MKIILVLLANFILLNVFCQTKADQGKKLFDEKRFQEAIKLLSPIKSSEKDYAAARYYLGRIAFELKQYDDASDYFEDAVDANEKVADYHSWLGNTYGAIAMTANPLYQGILAPKMRNAWEKAMQLDPKNLDCRWALVQYYMMAPSFMGGSIEKAKEMAIQLGKANKGEGHHAMGSIYQKEKKTALAEKEYLEMMKENPTKASVLANFYFGLKQFDKAFLLFEETLKNSPNDYLSMYQLGKTSAISGQKLDRGEDCLKKYLAHSPKLNEPSLAAANMRLGQIIEKKGNKVEAKRLYNLAIKGDASLKDAKDGLARVSK